MMRIVDAGLSLPSLMVIIILSVHLPPDARRVIIFIIAVFYWFGVARLVRGETLALRTREYVQAVKVIGGRPLRVGAPAHRAQRDRHDHRAGHVRGRRLDPDPVRSSASSPSAWRRPRPTGASMLSGGLNYIQGGNYWWLIYPPGVVIILTCIAFNFIGDALRDAFETRLQRR